ncbi:MFS transporter, putative [Bodo saltans]|uniref:MFS transporter, putative n=1 Tax=Bodo saltans TaxID=75058 RepID=A0A0S4JBW8_BODSA|nr:MFS transporter, putative [Bodo saltans]|eukprot:CUG85540.1 MFS transporter, putative [Bodo saltans]
MSNSSRIHELEAEHNEQFLARRTNEEANLNSAPISLTEVVHRHGGLIFRVGTYAMNIIQLRTCRKLLLPLAAMSAGLRPSVVGLMLSLSFAVDATLFFLGGMIMDKFGRKYSAIPTSVNLGFAFFLLGQAQGMWSLAAASIAFGLADSLGAGLLLTLNADYAPKDAGPEFIGVFRTVQDSGQLFGPLLASWLMLATSFQTTCFVFGTLGLLNAIWALFLLPANDESTDTIQ